MSALYTYLVLAFAAAGLAAACTTGTLVVGDDSTTEPPSSSDAAPAPDAAPPADAATSDAGPDAPPGSCESEGGACLPAGTACEAADTTGLSCGAAGDFCCSVQCPELSPPSPSFCDGGPTAAEYDAKRCIVGYACAPVSCTTAGGQCVAVSPGSCASGNIGDANKYSCGGGLGVMCCLP
jgi:hypothetical protein